ncbi:hypothetical protein GDO78_022776 [Eleutherodactylus coqui]|uniref:Uncharacterized protein n=1 Tax=Eleutherodactylus coqui TaxID=57060 RepID=A0A8J6EG97_ELECQ|nr:hypothetical protein GDO78_022776 [Eleutherodactylus coqui]
MYSHSTTYQYYMFVQPVVSKAPTTVKEKYWALHVNLHSHIRQLQLHILVYIFFLNGCKSQLGAHREKYNAKICTSSMFWPYF